MKENNDTVVKKDPVNLSKDDDEDLLYTHKPEDRGSTMQWNSAFCRKPGH